MFDVKDLFQWERFITPSIIKLFYWLAIVLIVLAGVSGILSGLGLMVMSPIGGLLMIFSSVIAIAGGIIIARIAAEFVLIVFRINEHLGAIRDQGEQ